MKYKVHWLIDGLVEVEAKDVDKAEDIIKNKIESLNHNENIINEILMFKARISFREKDFITAKKYIDKKFK